MNDLITALIICLFPPIAMALKLMLRRIINETDGERRCGMSNETIINVLKDMLSNLCEGCGGCKNKCLDYQVLEYLIKEKGGAK